MADIKIEIQFSYEHWSQASWAQPFFQLDKTYWVVVSAAVEQSKRKANMVAQGDESKRIRMNTTENIQKTEPERSTLWVPRFY